MNYHTGDALADEKNRVILDSIPPESKVLELGCHTGGLTRELEKRRCNVVAIDKDPQALAIAAQGSKCSFVQWSLDNSLPDFLDSDFEFVLAVDIAEHVASPESLLEDLYSKTKRGGYLLLVGPNVAFWRVRLDLLCGKWEYRDTGIMDRMHLRFFTLKGWIKLVEDAGFDVNSSRGINAFLPGRRLLSGVLPRTCRRLERTMVRYFPGFLATQFLIVARKS